MFIRTRRFGILQYIPVLILQPFAYITSIKKKYKQPLKKCICFSFGLAAYYCI